MVLPFLAITLVTALQIGRSIDPDYATRGSVLLIGSNVSGGDAVNPLAELRSPLNTTALAIGLIAVDEQTRTEVRELGFEGNYQVDVTPNTPIINIRVLAASPGQALLTLEAVIDAVLLKLDERQRGVEAPENSLIQGETLTKTTTARAIYGSRDRAVAGIMAVGLVAAAAAAVLVDAYVERSEPEEQDEDNQKVASLHGGTDVAEPAPERRRLGRRSRAAPKQSLDDARAPSGQASPRHRKKARRAKERALVKERKANLKRAKQDRKNTPKSTKEGRKPASAAKGGRKPASAAKGGRKPASAAKGGRKPASAAKEGRKAAGAASGPARRNQRRADKPRVADDLKKHDKVDIAEELDDAIDDAPDDDQPEGATAEGI